MARTRWRCGAPRPARSTRARAGDGPSLIECKTYRYYGHHQGDDTLRYRLADEEKLRARPGLPQSVSRALASGGPLTPTELNAIDAQNQSLLDEAVEFAKASPVPEPDELLTDVYAPVMP